MTSVAKSSRLVDDIVRLRRAERTPAVAADIAPVRRELEAQLGPTLSRSRAALILGVSQTTLDRWVAVGQIPIVLTPHGRKEVPRRFVVELREAIDELLRKGRRRHLLGAALGERREAAAKVGDSNTGGGERHGSTPRGHRTAERRSLAYHALVADRLDERLVEEARERVDSLASQGRLHSHYAERWRFLLSRPPGDIARAILEDSEEGHDLRQNSPFAGVLNEQERRRIIETVG